jgi:hypothetical protein
MSINLGYGQLEVPRSLNMPVLAMKLCFSKHIEWIMK